MEIIMKKRNIILLIIIITILTSGCSFIQGKSNFPENGKYEMERVNSMVKKHMTNAI
jgi:uncharacterized protein YceK